MNIINDNFHMDMDMACHCLDPDRFFCCEPGTLTLESLDGKKTMKRP